MVRETKFFDGITYTLAKFSKVGILNLYVVTEKCVAITTAIFCSHLCHANIALHNSHSAIAFA